MLKLYTYFGVVGIASILFWLAAAVLYGVYWRDSRRNLRYLLAFGLGLVGLVLARINSTAVSEIRVDRTEEMEEARRQQREMRVDASGESNLAAQMHFAEDAPTDETAPTNGLMAAEGGLGEAEPAYRTRGKQQRAADRKEKVGDASAVVEATEKPPKMLKELDANRANTLDRHNLRAARLVFWAGLILLLWDYLIRFNRWMPGYPPLPVSAPWLDDFSTKSYTCTWPGANSARLLRDLVRRGETFLAIAPDDPLPVSDALPRLELPPLRIGHLRLPRLTAWMVPKLVLREGDSRGWEFLFDAAWFNRYAVVYHGSPESLAAALRSYLEDRRRTRARARCTVTLCCAAGTFDEETRRALMRLMTRANWRLCEWI